MDKAFAAYKEIKRRIDIGTWNEGDKLPSLDQMADSCHVSRMTMWRAIDRLRKNDLLHTRGRLIICGKSSNPAKSRPAHTGFAWERLKNRIGQDLHAHAFADNQLPPISKLAMQYGSAVNTLKKALDNLVADNLLTRNGRRYCQQKAGSARYQSSVVLIARGDAEHGVLATDPRTEQLVRSFERECQTSGFSGRLEGFDCTDPKAFLTLSATIRSMKNVAGFIINLWPQQNPAHWQIWIDLLQFLLLQKVPVVAIDQEGNLSLPRQLFESGMCKVLRIAGMRAGAAMADTLMQRGYRRFSYLTYDIATHWANSRFLGLKSYIDSFGGAKAFVESVSLEKPIDMNDLTIAVFKLNAQKTKAVLQSRSSLDQLEALTRKMLSPEWRDLVRRVPSNHESAAIQDFARFLATLNRRKIMPRYTDPLFDALWTTASTLAMESQRLSVFDSVMASAKSDVWICSDDQTAYSALAYLDKNKKQVPADIAVAGFDDWRESLGHGLTTYNFNMRGIVQQALHLIRDSRLRKAQPAISEAEGYVVERRTTRNQ